MKLHIYIAVISIHKWRLHTTACSHIFPVYMQAFGLNQNCLHCLPKSVGADLNTDEVSETGIHRFEPFISHRIHVKVPYSGGLIVVRTDSKLFEHIESMSRYLRVVVYWWFEQNSKFSKHIKFMLNCSIVLFQTDWKFFQHIEFMYSYSLFVLVYTSGWNRFETFQTHQIPVKLLHTAGLLVVWTDSNLS